MKIVIAGGGFAGLSAATYLDKTLARRADVVYSTRAQLASIGRRTGVAKVGGVKFSGFAAWWLWRTVYLMKLPRLSKKLRVLVAWTLDLLFGKDIEHLVTVRDVEAVTRRLEHLRARDGQLTGSVAS